MASRKSRSGGNGLSGVDAAILDQQLLTSGAFSPLLWLLDTGQLAYGDYERWRQGELESLDSVLELEPDGLLAQLRPLAQQATRLGLVNETQTYFAWAGSGVGQSLTLSRHTELGQALGQHWTRPADRLQLDLFMDNSLIVAENQLADALAARHWERAEQACQQLAQLAPEHAQLAGYEGLIAYGRHLQAQPQVDARSLAEEWQGLQREVLPLAQELLRQQARDYLAAAWRRLAQALEGVPFDPSQADFHASHAWAQLPDWPRVIAAIRATPDWGRSFTLVLRLAQASRHGQPELATLLYCALLQLDPVAARALFQAGEAPSALAHHWRGFHELDDELPVALFPAYVLIREPGLVRWILSGQVPPFSHSVVQATVDLLAQRQSGGHEIAQRQALKAASPTLLALYLGQRG